MRLSAIELFSIFIFLSTGCSSSGFQSGDTPTTETTAATHSDSSQKELDQYPFSCTYDSKTIAKVTKMPGVDGPSNSIEYELKLQDKSGKPASMKGCRLFHRCNALKGHLPHLDTYSITDGVHSMNGKNIYTTDGGYFNKSAPPKLDPATGEPFEFAMDALPVGVGAREVLDKRIDFENENSTFKLTVFLDRRIERTDPSENHELLCDLAIGSSEWIRINVPLRKLENQ